MPHKRPHKIACTIGKKCVKMLGISDWSIIWMYLHLMKAESGMLRFNYRVLSQLPWEKRKGDNLFHLYVLSVALYLLHHSCRITTCELLLMGHLLFTCFSHIEIAVEWDLQENKKSKKTKTNSILFRKVEVT